MTAVNDDLGTLALGTQSLGERAQSRVGARGHASRQVERPFARSPRSRAHRWDTRDGLGWLRAALDQVARQERAGAAKPSPAMHGHPVPVENHSPDGTHALLELRSNVRLFK